MTGLSILALLAGLACIPVLDPGSRFWLRARWRARRERLAQLPPRRRPRTSSGPPLHERLFPPPGSRGYQPTRKVNPATICIPSSPSAVTPPPPSPLRAAELTAMVNAAKARGARGDLQPGAQGPVADSLMVAEAEMLRAGLKSARKSWEENIRGGWLALADSDRETIGEISERLRKAMLAPKPRRISPPGPSPIPRKPPRGPDWLRESDAIAERHYREIARLRARRAAAGPTVDPA